MFISLSEEMPRNYRMSSGRTRVSSLLAGNFYYGIREHAMGAILNGMSFYGLHRVSGSTFLVFSDYMRASVTDVAVACFFSRYIFLRC